MQILAVVVLYKRGLEESETIRGLIQSFRLHPELRDSIGLLVWDNSPEPLGQVRLPFPFEYTHSGENVGVSGAYNRALKIAERLRCPWMLLLDQDTAISGDYLDRIYAYSLQFSSNSDIAAVAPFLLDGAKSISPGMIHFYGISLLSPPFSGIHKKELYAANSGTLMRVSALKESGGYDEDFWLDFSDIVVFHRMYLSGKRLYVAGDLRLPHEITCNDYDSRMSPQRYRNFMNAEDAYCDLYRPGWQNAIQILRLLARTIKQSLRFKNKEFSKITWEHFRGRIFLSKTQRLMRWKRQLCERDLPAVLDGQVIG